MIPLVLVRATVSFAHAGAPKILIHGDTLLHRAFPTPEERETGKIHDWRRLAERS
jgi:hypothetical protein